MVQLRSIKNTAWLAVTVKTGVWGCKGLGLTHGRWSRRGNVVDVGSGVTGMTVGGGPEEPLLLGIRALGRELAGLAPACVARRLGIALT